MTIQRRRYSHHIWPMPSATWWHMPLSVWGVRILKFSEFQNSTATSTVNGRNWTPQSSYDVLPQQRCQNAKCHNSFSHFNLSKMAYFCTIFIWENPEQCGLFIDVLNSKTRTYNLLPLQWWTVNSLQENEAVFTVFGFTRQWWCPTQASNSLSSKAFRWLH